MKCTLKCAILYLLYNIELYLVNYIEISLDLGKKAVPLQA